MMRQLDGGARDRKVIYTFEFDAPRRAAYHQDASTRAMANGSRCNLGASTSREAVCRAAREAQRGTVDASRADDPGGAEALSTVRV